MPSLIQPDSGDSCCGCRTDCGPCCTVTYQTRSVAFAKCGYYAQNLPTLPPADAPACGICATSAQIASDCPQTGASPDADPRWYHRRYLCWASWNIQPALGLGEVVIPDGTQQYDEQTCFYSGLSNLYMQCSATASMQMEFPSNTTIDPGACSETANNYIAVGESIFVSCFPCGEADTTCSDCSPTAASIYLGSVNNCPACGDYAEVVASGAGNIWPLYYDEPYSDQEAVGYARTRIDAEGWTACDVEDGCAASISFDAGGGIDHTDVYITDLQYTITPPTEGETCYWTVRFTDGGGGTIDTPMSGSGTYTITPGEGAWALGYDGNDNYSSGAGTWEIIVDGDPSDP